MCSCCPEPLDLRVESKKLQSNKLLFHNDYPDITFDPTYQCSFTPSINFNRQFIDISQRSPHSEDDGIYDCDRLSEEVDEKIIPDFETLQNPDARCKVVRRRSSASLKEKKKQVPRDSPSLEKERRKPGRKPGQVSNVLHLWEFMRDLLRNPSNHGIIEWISKPEGVFRVVNSTEVARLWGEKKKNKKKMTYEKLSRSLRYSRLEGYFSDLPKDKNYPKKLCFKFGPKSNNWY